MSTKRPQRHGDTAVVTETRTKTRLKRPKLYKVLLHNDDFTTMEFVVAVLMTIFNKGEPEAHAIMLHVHRNGVGVAGVFTYEIAEAKVNEVMKAAEEAEYPLLCTFEPDDLDDPDGGEGGGGGSDERRGTN
jgi:ATP-dependent Clp protease adaptor protein ClpS